MDLPPGALASSRHAARRHLVNWSLAGAVVLSGLIGLAALLWYRLPVWAPEWVERHSPWLEPILRAAAEHGESDEALMSRLEKWPVPPGPALARALDHRDLRVRRVAALCLRNYPDPVALEPLLRDLGVTEFDLGEAAAQALLAIPDGRATAQVLARLADVDAKTGRVLLAWLVANGDWSALRPVVESVDPVVEPFTEGPGGPWWHRQFGMSERSTIWDMADRLRAAGQGRQAAATITPLLAHAQARWRRMGVELVLRLGAVEQEPRLVALLLDGAEDVRGAACDALRTLAGEDPGAFAALEEELIGQLAPGAGPGRREVVRVLAAQRGQRARAALAEVVRRHAWDAATRLAAIEGLAQATDPTAVAALVAVLAGHGGDGLPARQLAARSLGDVHVAAAERALIDACADAAVDVRMEAVAGLTQAVDPSADAALAARLGDEEESVRAITIEGLVARRHAQGIAALVALVATAQRDPGLADGPDAVTPTWVMAYDGLRTSAVPLDDAQGAVLAAMAERCEALRRAAPVELAPAVAAPGP